METQTERLGKVAITVEQDYWNINKDYDKLVIVEVEGANTTYLSRKPVPAGTSIHNRKYWIKQSKFSENQYEISQNFGNSPELAISQKVLTESRDNLQAQIDAIVSDKAAVSLAVSTGTFIVGERTFTLTASTNTNAESIVIKQGDNVIATGSGKNLSQVVTVEQTTAGNIGYTAEFTFAGSNKKTANATVYFVNKIYVGSGAVYTDVVTDSHAVSARRSPAGTYNVTVEQNGQYVFFVIPATMSITKATLSGFDFPLDAPVTETIDNVSYKVYRSSNTNDAGTYQIVIS